jgi:hypothetical protein
LPPQHDRWGYHHHHQHHGNPQKKSHRSFQKGAQRPGSRVQSHRQSGKTQHTGAGWVSYPAPLACKTRLKQCTLPVTHPGSKDRYPSRQGLGTWEGPERWLSPPGMRCTEDYSVNSWLEPRVEARQTKFSRHPQSPDALAPV